MGQYYKLCNLTKKEFVNPHKVGVGLKMWEQVCSFPGTGSAVLILIGAPAQRGGGDIYADVPEVAGRWHGDRIALIGDYAEPGNIEGVNAQEISNSIFSEDGGKWTDISDIVAQAIEKLLNGQFSGDGWRDFNRGEGFSMTACECCRKEENKNIKKSVASRRKAKADKEKAIEQAQIHSHILDKLEGVS
jgi:hypothetical protein